MARPGVQRRPGWTMHVHFEPTRLHAAPLVAAYDAALPVQQRHPVPAPVVPCPESQGDEQRRA